MNIQTSDPKGVADVLERAADRLEKPGAWTQKANARDRKGWPTWANGPAAVCWCVAGAIIAEASGAEYPVTAAALKAILPKRRAGLDPIVAWNDRPERTQEEVVSKLREAAALSRAHQEGGL